MISIIKDTINKLKILEELKDNSSGAVVFFTGIVGIIIPRKKLRASFMKHMRKWSMRY